jgi:hypothetical protein
MFTTVLPSHSKIIFSIIFSIIVNIQLSAQTLTAVELNDYLSSTGVKKSRVTTTSKQAETNSLESLVYDLHPTAYIQNGEIKIYGDKPVVKAELSPSSFPLFNSGNPALSQIELLVVKLNADEEANIFLDFSQNRDFKRLKYVYVQCPFECSPSQVEKMIYNLPQGVTLLFSVSNPE